MNVLIFDSVLERVRKNAAAFPTSVNVFFKRGSQIVSHPNEEPVAGNLNSDLVLLHADETDEQLLQNYVGNGTVKAASVLRYSGGGYPGGIPWPVRSDTPLTQSVTNDILSVCERFSPGQREQEFKRMWGGVPELLLAWAVSKHFGLDLPPQSFKASEVANDYNRLQVTVALRSSAGKNVPAKTPDGVFPRIEDARLLIELSRVDL